jgi:hypothetical protein
VALSLTALGCGGGVTSNDAGTGGGAAGASGRGGGGGGGGGGGNGGSTGAAGTGGAAAGASGTSGGGSSGAAGTSGSTGTGGGAAGAGGRGGGAGTGGGSAGRGGSSGGSGGSGGGAAGTGGSSNLACGVTPCGGNLVGNWSLTGGCIDKTSLEAQLQQDSYCPTLTLNSVTMTESGTVTFTVTNYSVAANRTITFSENVPLICIDPATCADLEYAYSTDPTIQSVSCTGTTLCTCLLTLLPQSGSEQGTYTTAGSSLITTPAGGTAATSAYCVQGGTLHLLGLDTAGQVNSDQTATHL